MLGWLDSWVGEMGDGSNRWMNELTDTNILTFFKRNAKI